MHITAARGETEPFQVAVRAVHGSVRVRDLDISALNGPGQAVIRANAFTLYREHFVRLRRHSPEWSGPVLSRRWYPDALLPFRDPSTGRRPNPGARHAATPYTIALGRTQPFWIDLAVPRRAAPGRYTGTWKLSTNVGTRTGRVQLRVRDFTLPRRPLAASSFHLWRDDHRAAKKRMLLDFELQPQPIAETREARLVRRGLTRVDLGFWSGANISTCTMRPPPSMRTIHRAIRRHDRRLELSNYTADEISDCPGLDRRLETYARRLHRAGVDQLVTMVPRRGLLNDGTGRPAVDTWVLLPARARRLAPELRRAVQRRDAEFWSYQALVQGADTPSWEIDFPAANFRVLPGFLNASRGFRGVLYWAADYWRPNPWRDVVYDDSGCCYPGEGSLLYPGGPAGIREPIPSIRHAWIREGMEDYAYVELLRRRHGSRWRTLIEPAASSWRTWTRRPEVILRARDAVGDALER